MKIIRRTRLKITRRESIIVKNETPKVCPVCNFPNHAQAPLENETFAKALDAGDRKPPEPSGETD